MLIRGKCVGYAQIYSKTRWKMRLNNFVDFFSSSCTENLFHITLNYQHPITFCTRYLYLIQEFIITSIAILLSRFH